MRKPKLSLLATLLSFGVFFGNNHHQSALAQDNSEPAIKTGKASPKGLSWNPATTKVFIVGVLKWKKGAGLDSFDSKNRSDASLRDFFLKAGVPPENVVYLSDSEATLSTIQGKLATLLGQTQPGDFLFTYYCGHGWLTEGEPYFGNYDAGDDPESCWSMKEFATELQSGFKGENALVTADCCYSGNVAVQLNKSNPSFKYATLTSASPSEASTGNWTFTTAVLDALQGHRFADYNNDGMISYEELAQYVKEEMRAFERQSATTIASLEFAPQFCLASVQNRSEAIPERVKVLYEGTWYKARMLEQKEGQAKIHWIEIGSDSADDEEWVPLSTVKK